MRSEFQIYNINTSDTVFQGTLKECLKEVDQNPKKYEDVQNYDLREKPVSKELY